MGSEDTRAVIRQIIRERMDHRVTHLDDLADLLRQRADDLRDRLDARDAWAATVDARLAALMAAATSATRLRTLTLTLPQLEQGATEVVVVWDTPLLAADYGVSVTVEAANAAVARISAGVKAGTRTEAGCTVTVVNGAAVAVPAGARLHVLGWRTPATSP